MEQKSGSGKERISEFFEQDHREIDAILGGVPFQSPNEAVARFGTFPVWMYAYNAVSGVAQAYKDSLPVLVLSSDVDRAHAHKGVSSWHEIPQREIFAPLTKMSVTLERAEDIIEVLRPLEEAEAPRMHVREVQHG